ncbi:class IV adenylate cyclase [Candidatus Poribacteria bacterium]|nr:class IV adenylate cyclase [Candidatus Poribacteria bacterium]
MTRNIELKVFVNSFAEILPLLKNMGAKFEETLRQVDTYYGSANGRLKIREINGRNFELIFYERPNSRTSRISDYTRIDVAPEQLHALKGVLKKTFGERVAVRKERKLWMHGHTRIHLDKVESLGTFIELETVVKEERLKEARMEHNKIVESLGLSRIEKLGVSYSDMLLRKKQRRWATE